LEIIKNNPGVKISNVQLKVNTISDIADLKGDGDDESK
jgi:hypothetical protein